MTKASERILIGNDDSFYPKTPCEACGDNAEPARPLDITILTEQLQERKKFSRN